MIRSTAPQDIAAIQRLLARANYDPGMADGIAGARTLAAAQCLACETGEAAPLAPDLPALIRAADWTAPPAGWPQAKRLRSLDPAFRATVVTLLADLAGAGFRPVVASAWRSAAQQAELVRTKRSTVRFSFHNATTPDGRPAALAADLIDARWAWISPACTAFFTALGAAAVARGLIWGGDWKSFPDVAHVQALPNDRLTAVRRASIGNRRLG